MNRLIVAALIFASGFVSACATHGPRVEQSVGYSMALPQGAARQELTRNESFIMASRIGGQLPRWPDGDVPGPVSVVICVEIIVSASGTVDSVEQIVLGPECERPHSQRSELFLPGVRDALLKWTYLAAALCKFDAAEDECDQPSANLEPLSIKLGYEFRFVQDSVRGRAPVEQVH